MSPTSRSTRSMASTTTITYLCHPPSHIQKAGKKCPVFFAGTLESYDCKTSRDLLVLCHKDTTGIPKLTFASNTLHHAKNSQQRLSDPPPNQPHKIQAPDIKIMLQALTKQVLHFQSLLYSTQDTSVTLVEVSWTAKGSCSVQPHPSAAPRCLLADLERRDQFLCVPCPLSVTSFPSNNSKYLRNKEIFLKTNPNVCSVLSKGSIFPG